VDPNSATDGDLEIAWAYLLAAQVFQDEELSARGETILRAVRRASALPVQGGWFPAAGDWAVAERIANLSYFLPYAHPWFAMADPEGDWDRVTEVGYDLIRRFRDEPGRRLPPAFFRLEPSGSTAPLATDSELETDFSFDAIRLFWRVEADCRITGRRPACSDPVGVAEALEVLVEDDGIVSRYAPDGTPLTDAQSPTFYAALLAPARRYAPNVARDLLAPRLAPGALAALLEARDRYYDHNWVWFGIALDRGLIEARTPSPPTR
jgi:hypothetical protein